MKVINFRLIELESHQVLLEKRWDDEEDKPAISIVFHENELRIEQKHGYNNEENRDRIFETFTAEQAQKCIDVTKKLFQ